MLGMHIARHKGLYIGNEAKEKASYLNINYPINRGIITDWDAMEEVVNVIANHCVLYYCVDLALRFSS